MNKIVHIAFIFIALQSYAQKNQWVRKYSIGNNYSDGWSFIIEDYDKGFFIAYQGAKIGYGSWVYKTDVNGNILWKREINQSHASTLMGAALTPDGGLVVDGAIRKTDSTNDNYLIKLNACGQVVLNKVYDLNQYSLGGPIAIFDNGNIVVSSYVAISSEGKIGNYYQSWTYCTDPQGNIKWQVFDDLNVWSLNIVENKTILKTGSRYMPYMGNPNDLVIEYGLIKMDSSGNRIWYIDYDNKKNIAADGSYTVPTSDNGYLSLADQRNKNAVMILKFNAGGGTQWSKLIGDTQKLEFCWGMSNANNGAYLVSAGTNVDSSDVTISDLKLIKINEQGQVLNEAIYRDTSRHERVFYNVGVTSDGKYTLISSCNYGGNRDSLMVMKLNQNLALDTFYTHNNNKYDYLCNHKITFDSTIYVNTSNPVPITVPFPADTSTPPTVTIVNPGSFTIYPNPSSGGIIQVLCLEANIPASATVYDMLGRLIGKYSFTPGNLGQAHLNIGSWSPGCYVMILEQGGKKYIQKLIME